MPPIILVALYNIDRDRDFLPSHSSDIPTSCGADKFLSFFKQELIPYINKTYPTNGHNLLFGHSFGGVFATYALLTEPQLFDNYLAVDPSYWWDKGYMNKLAARKIEQQLRLVGVLGDLLDDVVLPERDAQLGTQTAFQEHAAEVFRKATTGDVGHGLRFDAGGFESLRLLYHDKEAWDAGGYASPRRKI